MKFIKKLSVVFAAAMLLNACADSASINQEAAVSYRQAINKVQAQGALDTTSNTAKRVKKVFNQMVPYANKANHTGVKFNWEINVIKSKELNAWAMPGGKMVFYTGLVNKLKLSDNEIAVVMGHEMAHALLEHGKAQRNVGILTNIGVALGQVGLAAVGVNDGGLLGTTASLAVTNPYSRSHETQADEIGLMLMAESGYDPSVAPNMWKKMTAVSGDISGAATLFSTHPNNADRQANLQRLLPEAMKVYQASKKN
ncbi:Zn-dependent protease with chaperone function [Cricetibacter osteomyelitidis]|uniref:Zn-dependent protease with chaperone function n=1 Tax=Cricetibacter osteomyelitidis TaxID=1521931 RepID=A0A4R2T1F8_9PAST|nr:M48 family metallopeptidase [Cricetibacter osteomyelitidis]TCP95960.1 Zn-dependent protease with chaperone function [Cricetibacter osteomyelitidis]